MKLFPQESCGGKGVKKQVWNVEVFWINRREMCPLKENYKFLVPHKVFLSLQQSANAKEEREIVVPKKKNMMKRI